MRHQHVVRLIAPLLLALAPAAACAQSGATAQSTVTVRIPTVLRMSVTTTPQAASSQSDALDPKAVSFHINDGQVDPASVTVKVFSNDTWSLSVEETGGSGPDLQYKGCDRSAWTQTVEPSTACYQRPPTGGWLSVPLQFRVASPAPQGSYTRTLTFTLSHP